MKQNGFHVLGTPRTADSRRGLLGHDFRRHCGALKIEEKEEREKRKEEEREREREEDDDDKMMR